MALYDIGKILTSKYCEMWPVKRLGGVFTAVKQNIITVLEALFVEIELFFSVVIRTLVKNFSVE